MSAHEAAPSQYVQGNAEPTTDDEAERSPPPRTTRLGFSAASLFIGFGMCSFSLAPSSQLQAGVLALSILAVLPRWSAVRSIRLPAPLMLLIAWIALSLTWSVRAGDSINSCFSLITAILSVLIGAAIAGFTSVEKVVIQAFKAIVLISLIYVMFRLNQPAATSVESGWTGPFVSKNWLGFHSAQAMLMLFVSAIQIRTVASVLWVLGAIFLLVGSNSATSQLAGLAVVGLYIIARSVAKVSSRPLVRAALLLPLVGLIMSAVILLPQRIGSDEEIVLGRSGSLTGRTELWQAVLDETSKHRLLGVGYGGFWHNSQVEVQRIWERIGWTAPSAHNALLDALLQSGLVGAALLLLSLLSIAVAAGRRQGLTKPGFWLLILLIIQSLTERGVWSSSGLAVLTVVCLLQNPVRKETGSFLQQAGIQL